MTYGQIQLAREMTQGSGPNSIQTAVREFLKNISKTIGAVGGSDLTLFVLTPIVSNETMLLGADE